MLETVLQDDVQIVTLKNGKTNPINLEILTRLNEIVREADENPSPKGIVLTGEGRFFSSGFDLPIFINFKDKDEAIAFFTFAENVLTNLFACRKPVVAAVNGHCAAGGLIFSMAADYRIIKDHPKIKVGMTEIKIGLPLTIAQHEVMRFGFDSSLKYRDVMFFGDMVDVHRAKELKLMDEIVAEEDLVSRAVQVVSQWIDTPNRPFMALKTLLRQETADRIRRRLAEKKWHDGMDCFFREDVRQTLEFVQAGMQ